MILPLAVAAGLALIAGVAAAMAFGFGLSGMGTLGPGALPLGAALLLLVTAVATTFRRGSPANEGDEGPVDRLRVSGYLLGVATFALAFAQLGALTAVAGLFLFILKLVERLSWKTTLVISVLAVAGTWLLFERLLSVPLPRGLLR